MTAGRACDKLCTRTGRWPRFEARARIAQHGGKRANPMTELWRLSAREVGARLRKRELKPSELIDVALARIAAVGAPVNALPTLCAERARATAQRLPTAASDDPGWLAGLPIAIKDTADVAGVRTTYGSPIYAAHVPP